MQDCAIVGWQDLRLSRTETDNGLMKNNDDMGVSYEKNNRRKTFFFSNTKTFPMKNGEDIKQVPSKLARMANLALSTVVQRFKK